MRWLTRMTAATVLLALIIGAALSNAIRPEGLAASAEKIEDLSHWAIVVRLIALAILIVAWPAILGYCQTRYRVSATTVAQLHGMRWRIALWCVAIELAVGLDALNVVYAGLLT